MKNNLIKAMLPACIIFIFFAAVHASAQLPWPQVTFNPATSSAADEDAVVTVTSPAQGEVVTLIRDCDTCPAFIDFEAEVSNFVLGAKTSGGFPCDPEPLSLAADTIGWKGDGQHLYIVIDNAEAQAITDLNIPLQLEVPQPTPGPHTIRVYMSRSWDESLKAGVSPARSTDLYAVHTFYIGNNTGTHAIDTTKPLLTPNSPLDTNLYKYPVDSVLFDFYMMFKDLSDGYAVEATIYDSTMTPLGRDTLTQWVPYCISGLEEPPVGRLRKYIMQVRLLDSSGNPVTNGPGNFNNRQWAFWVRRS